jgi:hypothetical protein
MLQGCLPRDIRQIRLKYIACQDLKSKVNAFTAPATRASGEAARSHLREREGNHDLFCTQRKPTRKTAPAADRNVKLGNILAVWWFTGQQDIPAEDEVIAWFSEPPEQTAGAAERRAHDLLTAIRTGQRPDLASRQPLRGAHALRRGGPGDGARSDAGQLRGTRRPHPGSMISPLSRVMAP